MSEASEVTTTAGEVSFQWVVQYTGSGVDSVVSNGTTRLTGESVEFTATELGWYEIVLTATNLDGGLVRISDRMMSKYVRRELRTLLEDDRTAMLDALQTGATTPYCHFASLPNRHRTIVPLLPTLFHPTAPIPTTPAALPQCTL